MTFEVEGFEEFKDLCENFAEDLRTVEAGIPTALDNATEEAARDLEAEMKAELQRLNAVDSGTLLESIESREIEAAEDSGTAVWATGPTVDYAKYVEFGTNPHTITPEGTTPAEVRERREMVRNSEGGDLPEEVKDAPALQFNAGGETVTVDMVEHPGSQAKPFFRNSVRRHHSQRRLAKSINKHTNRLFKGVMQ